MKTPPRVASEKTGFSERGEVAVRELAPRRMLPHLQGPQPPPETPQKGLNVKFRPARTRLVSKETAKRCAARAALEIDVQVVVCNAKLDAATGGPTKFGAGGRAAQQVDRRRQRRFDIARSAAGRGKSNTRSHATPERARKIASQLFDV